MPHKIMLIEDDRPILDMMEILLKRIGYEPILVPDVLDALKQVKENPPALILLDIMMTPINGWEFLDKLRGENGKKQIMRPADKMGIIFRGGGDRFNINRSGWTNIHIFISFLTYPEKELFVLHQRSIV